MVQTVTVVEIDPMVIEVAKTIFEGSALF